MIQLDAQAKAMIDAVGKLRGDIAARQVRLQALRTFATDKNADVEVAQQELAQMQSELRNLREKERRRGFVRALTEGCAGRGRGSVICEGGARSEISSHAF